MIDISEIEERKGEVAKQLYDAAVNSGFCYIKGHGLSSELIHDVFAAGHKFMGLDNEVKKKYCFIPDRYLGWRSPDNIESVTGAHMSPPVSWVYCPRSTLPYSLL